LHRTGKFYVFLREIRHELFDGRLEAELAKAYKKPRGTAPLPPLSGVGFWGTRVPAVERFERRIILLLG
jgi:hypothetical protein